MEGNTAIPVKGRCFIIENICDKSGEVVCIKSKFINFTPNLKCLEKAKYITAYVKDGLNI